MKKIFGLVILGWTAISCSRQLVEDTTLVDRLMRQHPRAFRTIQKQKDSLEIQIIYTQIDRDSANHPHFRSFYYQVDSTHYFYPASTVKLPMVLLALEKMNRLKVPGLDKYTPMLSDSAYAGQHAVRRDTTAANGLPSVAHYAKKILLVSDNDAYNRLYEWVGQREANDRLRAKGYRMHILHRLERPLTPDQNRHTEPIRFLRHDSVIYAQPMLVNPDSIRPRRQVFKGIGYLKNDGQLVKHPFDFTYKNDYPLQEQQEILKAILFPQSVAQERRFQIPDSERKFVMQYMSELPREARYPAYYKDPNYTDAYCKFLGYADTRRPLPMGLRIFNKVGDAYGYLIDNAYFMDPVHGVEFMLSAVINTNTDGIYNDGKYAYREIGYPFMRALGKTIYGYEKKRHRPRKPDLSEFIFTYNQ